MEQTSRTLEFVTIMNPDEIKDPIKQRAIRRQARRRDNDSKAVSRKPFKIIFDLPLPGGDVHGGAEQSILGRQKAGSNCISPAEYQHSDQSALVPSVDFLRRISRDRPLIYTYPFPSELNPRVAQLVNFSKIKF